MTSNTRFIHPETGPGEVLLQYSDQSVYDRIPYTRKRAGIKVYNEFGREIDVRGAHPTYRRFPVFVPARDYAAVQEALMNSIDIAFVPI